ncbi:hypothetical protein K439DRAFT_1363416 [Ramaria rubella]|nr:hypothetical protein K439DRAFT_1363416 [Ramaria rubella]
MEPYSERHKVPTTQRFQSEQQSRQQESKVSSPTHDVSPRPSQSSTQSSTNLRPSDNAKDEKSEMMNKLAGPKVKPTDKVKQRKGERTVKDPTTGLDVIIKDADFKDYPSADESGPEVKTNGTTSANIAAPEHISPAVAKPGNVSLHPFLPPAPISLGPLLRQFDYLQIGLAAAFAFIWFFFGFPAGKWWLPFSWSWIGWVFRTLVIGGLGTVAVTSVSFIQRRLEKEVERVRADMHRERGEKFTPPMPESAEWLNAFTRTIWGLINPEMFVSIADMVEDIMQQSLPSFVDAVRISDVGQGTNSFRIVSMRALPDQPTDKEFPREEWIDQGTNDLMKKAEDDQNEGLDADQTGNYVNFEVAFSYRALPGQSNHDRSKNIHLLIEFFLGVYDWLHIPIPIWIQVEGIAGTIRLRLQFIPEPPFVRNVTFTFMGIPAVEVSAIPMAKALPNVLDLPLISRFVKMAIAAGTAEFVAPKSMTLNLKEMMSGTAIGDTRAIGVFIITIHHAKDLSAQDSNGLSDPYIVLAYAKFGKPLFSTRIILGDLNPCFEEMTALLVTRDELKSDEELSVMLWDSDQRSADDLIGRVQIPIRELVKMPNRSVERTDKLMGFEDADQMSGTLTWSIGYYTKVPLNKLLEREPDTPPGPPSRTAPQMEMRPGDLAPNPAAHDLPPPPPDVQRTPPDPAFPSGVLSVVIHQINNLERQNLKGTSGKEREGQAGQDTDEASEQSQNLPCAYCEIIINDDLIYKTRVKQYTTMPFFEAGTERFIRDWRSTVLRLVVRDSRLREKDPILGVVNLKLKDLLKHGSEVSHMFSIMEGIGFGRMSVSVLFRSVNVQLSENRLGWDTATAMILAPISMSINSDEADFRRQMKKLTISTTDSRERIPSSVGVVEDGAVLWKIDQLRLPVYNRYSSSLTFEIGGGSIPGSRNPDALAILWLQELVDDQETDVEIPVVVGKDLRQLRQNVLNDYTASTHEYKVIGHIKTRMKLDSGLDEDHEAHAKTQARRHAYETYDHVEGEAIIATKNAHANDDGKIDSQERKAIERAHKRQLANRQRGINGFRPYRTAIWMKEGLKSRIIPTKASAKRERTFV